MRRLALIGDSDIAYWPKELLPSLGNGATWDQVIVSGYPGATLAEIPPLQRVLIEHNTDKDNSNDGDEGVTKSIPKDDVLVVVACAGENDIGNGISFGKSAEALGEFTDAVFDETYNGSNTILIFLGPKFEPWLEHDPSCKKKYTAMAMSFGRYLGDYETTKQNNNHHIHFIDCLTMFCGESANIPGARLGGRAKAEPQFFASDQLHLSKEGYALWKKVVEDEIKQCLDSSK